MHTYLGRLGQLVELKGLSAQVHEVDDGYTFERTLEGRVKTQATSIRRRRWSVKVGAATPADMGKLFGFAAGEWGNGPFVWVTPDAQVTNMLSPAQATCDPVTLIGTVRESGPMLLEGGEWAGRSFTNPSPNTTLYFGTEPTAVLPGVPVTTSAHLLGDGAAAGVVFYTASGSIVSVHDGAALGVAGSTRRLSVTATPTDNVAYARVFAASSTQAARPALTWTDTVFDWADGAGCSRAVIHGLSRDVLLALRDPGGGRYANASLTVSEVG